MKIVLTFLASFFLMTAAAYATDVNVNNTTNALVEVHQHGNGSKTVIVTPSDFDEEDQKAKFLDLLENFPPNGDAVVSIVTWGSFHVEEERHDDGSTTIHVKPLEG